MQLRTLKENVAAWHKAVTDVKVTLFFLSVTNHSNSISQERRKRDGHLSWDKDDTDAMMFVAAAANIRCGIFQIEQKTEWKVKEMAGNIIPGIRCLNSAENIPHFSSNCDGKCSNCRYRLPSSRKGVEKQNQKDSRSISSCTANTTLHSRSFNVCRPKR